ncbi:helix-turn-helix transcriptional regulator [Pseudomonas zhanjiangensis]|uniref:Helix-turn-helix transcriptional regulator n=1 Tax=Pseudomonas zhanjiangensis TaxID=3239015 RepID=A0ABV3Z2X1_9PSED
MTEDNRIALRPAHAAAFLGCSPATLWRWTKTLESFPQPHKIPGQRLTVWFCDELAHWRDSNMRRGAKRKAYLELAQQCADRNPEASDPHPFVHAFLLAGGESLAALAVETDLPEEGLRRLAKPGGNYDLTDEALKAIFAQAIAQVLHREKVLRKRLEENPELEESPTFRGTLHDLDEAHRLTFGRTLMHYLIEEGRGNGNA